MLTFVAIALVKRYWVPSQLVGPLDIVMPAKNSLNLFVLGDTGKGNEPQYEVAQAMENLCKKLESFDGILLLGDNFYPSGVHDVNDPQWQEKVEKPYGSQCLAQAPIFAILGNHDYKKNPGAQIEYSRLHPRWVMPHRFYRVRWPGLLNLVAIDSNFPDFCLNSSSCVVDFLRSRLEQDERFNLVIGHHPLYSSSHGDLDHRESPSRFWLRPLACNSVDLWLAGHAHHLEYRSIDGCKTNLGIVGGGGGSLGKIVENPTPDVLFLKREYGFMHLHIDASKMHVTFVDRSGAELFQSVAPHLAKQ